jgi:phenylacetic acid degradation operon negative regulatory protein
LLWLGLGPLSRSAWLTPHDIAGLLRELVTAHGVQDHVALFEAAHLGPAEERALTARCWDLPAIASRYRGFTVATRRREALLRRRLRDGTLSDAGCFAERTRLVHEYRKFLFVDPGLPDALLPPAWSGKDAAQAFRDVYRLLTGPARRFLEAAFEPPPGRRRVQDTDPFSSAAASTFPSVERAPVRDGGGAYFPLKAGGRFSRNALTPSAASSLAKARKSASRS